MSELQKGERTLRDSIAAEMWECSYAELPEDCKAIVDRRVKQIEAEGVVAR